MTTEFWQKITGTVVAGLYPLRSLIGNTESSAVYVTSYQGTDAALKLTTSVVSEFFADPKPAAGQHEVPAHEANAHEANAHDSSAHDAIAQLDHPHIIRLFETGVCNIDQHPLRYFLMERADENLGPALAVRALSPDETREMLQPALQALAFLHERGLVHARVTPSNILAVGETLKLSADSIRRICPPATEAEDMRQLGLTVVEALTQHRKPSAVATLPQPFRDIVEHSLQRTPVLRWSARQAAMRLSGEMPGSAQAAAVALPAQPVSEVAPPAVVTSRVPSRDAKTLFVALLRKWQKDLAKFPIPIWIYPAIAVLMLVAVAFSLSRVTDPARAQSPVDAKNHPAKKHVKPVALPFQPKPTPFAPPPKIAAVPLAVSTKEEPVTARSGGAPIPNGPAGQGWFVITASYTRQEDADRQARSISQRFPEFKSSVLPPSEIDSHYLVVLGSGLSESNADALRQRAVDVGLPPDTYIKGYSSSRPQSPE